MPRVGRPKPKIFEKARCTSPLCAGRASGQLLMNLGDVHPFEHGGYFLYDRGDGTYTGHYWEEVEDSSDDDDPANNKFEVFIFDIPADVFAAYGWAKRDIRSIADTVGGDPSEMLRDGRSPDVWKRARVVQDIAATHGWKSLDSSPDFLTSDELRERYGRDHRVYRHRERGRVRSRQLGFDFVADDDD